MKINEKNRKHAPCLECGSSITNGREDKVFCSQKCKNAYHNREKHDEMLVRSHILATLNRNRDVLSRLFKAGISRLSITEAAELGMNTRLFTGITKENGHEIHHCFEYTYWLTRDQIRNISKSTR